MEEKDLRAAAEVYSTLISMLDKKDWHYEKNEEKLLITSSVSGDDLPIKFHIRIIPKNEIVVYNSLLPFRVKEEKRAEMAVAICAANYLIIDGSFDFDLSDGTIIFRLTSSYRGSIISEDLLEYILIVSSLTVDEYNDKLLMVSTGAMTVEQFIKTINE